MPTPHDYYDIHGMPRLHNVGEGRPYLENDYHANDHGPQVPSLSTIGRGPRGEGLKIGNVVNENGTVSFALYSDLTDELVWQSPNLDPGTLDFYPTDFRDLTAGQPAPMDIVYTKGGVTKTTTAYLPCGERGSLVFLLGGRSVPRVPSDTYQTTAEELMIYGHRVWPNDNKPLPHVNDIVFFRYTDGDETGIAFGTIETVGTRNNEETVPSTPIVYTARVFVPCTLTEQSGSAVEPLVVRLTEKGLSYDPVNGGDVEIHDVNGHEQDYAYQANVTAGEIRNAYSNGVPIYFDWYRTNESTPKFRSSLLAVNNYDTDAIFVTVNMMTHDLCDGGTIVLVYIYGDNTWRLVENSISNDGYPCFLSNVGVM